MKFKGLFFAFLFAAPAAAPVLHAQDSGAAGNNSQPTAGAPENKATEKKPKKVWTNESVGTLSGPISVVGDPPPEKTADKPAAKPGEKSWSAETKNGNTTADAAHAATIRKYRDEIAHLKTQIGLADAHISQMKNFKANNGTPSGGLDPNKGYTMLAPEEQIKLLEAKKKQLQAKIDDLEVQAEKEGIDPGELR